MKIIGHQNIRGEAPIHINPSLSLPNCAKNELVFGDFIGVFAIQQSIEKLHRQRPTAWPWGYFDFITPFFEISTQRLYPGAGGVTYRNL